MQCCGIDVEKSTREFFEFQKKSIKGIEVLLDIEDRESDATPKELVYQEDKMKLYHYTPMVKKPCKVQVGS